MGDGRQKLHHRSEPVQLGCFDARTFRPNSHFYLDARVDATNMLNHGVFIGWITTVNNTQFGLPMAANPMRSLETTLRVRF